VTAALLEGQLKALRDAGFRPVTLEQVAAAYSRGTGLPRAPSS